MSEGYLTTHILDTANGCPAANVKITLYRLEGETRHDVGGALTNDDGRTDTPMIAKGEMQVGEYELVFEIGAYYATRGLEAALPVFLNHVPVRFGINDAEAHYHVPLLVSPYGYSTYRGS